MANIKECFMSRFDDGYIMEADFSQLEVIGVAYLSQDKNMYEDILNGVDSHSQSASWLNDYSYEEIREGYLAGDEFFSNMRKKAKGPRFELQYGAGAKSIAENNGISKDAAQAFIDNYYGRYQTLKEWQDGNIRTVEQSRAPTDRKTASGVPLGTGVLKSITGREYRFYEFDAPEFLVRRGQLTSFSPTQIKNYPSQGFATGDVVPLVLGRLYRELKKDDSLRDRCLLINTVHDSVIFDCDSSVLDMAAHKVRDIMQSAPEMLKDRFGLDFDLPLNVDVEYGRNWSDINNFDFSK